MQITLVYAKFCNKSPAEIKYERILQMPIPYSLLNPNAPKQDDLHAWNDPRRDLYPHHAEFWPEETPEHVRFELEARELRKRKQAAWLRAFFRFQWFTACKAFWKKPLWRYSIFENPMEPEKPNDDSR